MNVKSPEQCLQSNDMLVCYNLVCKSINEPQSFLTCVNDEFKKQ